jgi:hypothetical protein
MIFAFRTLSQFGSSTVNNVAVPCAMLQHCLIPSISGVSKAEAGFDIDVRDEKTSDLVLIIEAGLCDIFVMFLVQGWQAAPHRLENVKVTMKALAWQNMIKIILYVTGRSRYGRHCPSCPLLTNLQSCLRLVQLFCREHQVPRRSHPALALEHFQKSIYRPIARILPCHSILTS